MTAVLKIQYECAMVCNRCDARPTFLQVMTIIRDAELLFFYGI